MSTLLDSSGDEEDTGDLKINEAYATSYNRFREKEQFQKLKDKYGEEAAKKSLGGEEDLDDSEEDSSSSEDEDAEALTDQIEKDFFKTMASLKTKDPKIYDGKTAFFETGEMKNKTKTAKEKPLHLGDLERKVMLEKGGTFEEIDDVELKQKAMGKSYVDEMHDLKESFKRAQNDESDEDDNLLKPKVKNKESTLKEDADYRKWLAGQKIEIKDKKTKNELGGLREFWSKKDLGKDEQFLRDYILNKKYLNNDEDTEDIIPKRGIQEQDNLSEDEKNLEVQEEFEHKYNYRFEEPDPEFIKRYPRTMQLQDTMRKKNNLRKKKRDDVKARKLEEKQRKREELKQLKALKRKEIAGKIQKLQKVVGDKNFCPFKEQDIDDDFDPTEYDKRMAEVFENYNDTGNLDEGKPEFSDLSDSDLEEELEVENWDEWTGVKEDKTENSNNLLCAKQNKAPEDKYLQHMSTQRELIELSSTRRSKKARKSKFAEALERSKPVFDPNDKTFERYLDEYYKLDYEDTIGDMPCRFKYRHVKANDFGLTAEEVLSAPDRELNAWCSLKKTCVYQDDKDELKDIETYKSKANDIQLKKKVIPSLFNEDGTEDALETEQEKKSAKSKTRRKQKRKKEYIAMTLEDNISGSNEDTISKKAKYNEEMKEYPAEINDKTVTEKKKRRNKKQNKHAEIPDSVSEKPKSIDKYKPSPFSKTGKFGVNKQTNKKTEVNAAMRMSDKRLEAYGIAPNTFKRKKIKEKYKQRDK